MHGRSPAFAEPVVAVGIGHVVERLAELDETVEITLTGITAGDAGITLGTVTDSIVILDNDSATVSISNATATEGGDLKFDVTLNKAVDVDTVITFSTADDTATEGATASLEPVSSCAMPGRRRPTTPRSASAPAARG